MPDFSKSIAVPAEAQSELEKRLYILRAQGQHDPRARQAILFALDEAIRAGDQAIAQPKMCRIRLSSRLYDDFPIESADRRDFLRVPTNRDFAIEPKWLPVLEAKLKPYQTEPTPQIALQYLD